MDELQQTTVARVMPNSLEAEQSVIGSMIVDGEAITAAMDILVPDDFYHENCRALFAAISALKEKGEPVDVVTIANKLSEMDVSPEVAGMPFLTELVTNTPVTTNVRSYAKIVKEKASLRTLIRATNNVVNDCYAGTDGVDAVFERTEKEIFSILQNRGAKDTVPIKDVVMKVLDDIETASKNRGAVTGVPTGFLDLDSMTAGLQKSDLLLIAARPSMGKTAFVLNIAQHIAFHEKRGAAIFSLEMSKEQLVKRLLAMESKVEATKLRTGSLTDGDWQPLIEGASIIGDSNLIIDDTPAISVSEMRSKCRKYKLEHPDLSVIMIDYLQLMTTSGRSESHQLEIAEISRSLKALARELDLPVIALSQLSRAVESRPDKRPMLSDLRDSGAIEQDADVVMFIYRDDYYHKDTDKKGVSEIIIAKQRNGPVGTVDLAWIPELTKFQNLDKRM
ncbi:MAG: replicative DNA helicase [Lachnospiraceae bacterium]|nr:replicative DNA helicase [Lachnospiraceae bacterium]